MARVNTASAQVAAAVAATLLISVSASQSVLHGWSLGIGQSVIHAAVFAGGSLGGALMQPFAFLATAQAFRTRQLGKGAVALALGLACFTYAASCSLGFLATARGDLTAQRTLTADKTKIQTDGAKAAAAELVALSTAPPAGRKTERERADRRKVLEAKLAAAEPALQAAGAPVVADPQAMALAGYLTALGYPAEADSVSRWLLLAMVLFFEMGSACSLIVVSALAPVRVPAPSEGESPPLQLAPEPADARPGRKRVASFEHFKDRLRARGGSITGLSAAAKLINGSKSATARLVDAAEAAGEIKVDRSQNGSVISLA